MKYPSGLVGGIFRGCALFVAGMALASPLGYTDARSFLSEPVALSRPLVLAIVPKSLDNPVFVEAMEAAELTARRLNVSLEWVAPFKMDPDAQVRIVEGLIRKKVDGIAISVSDPAKLEPVIARAAAAGIKVATMDADAPGSARRFYCGTDNFRAGYVCGEAVIRLVQKKGLADKVLHTAILTGGMNAHNLNERIRGFKAVTESSLNLKIQAVLTCDDDTVTAVKVVEAYIKGHPQTKVFFFSGGWAFFGPTETMPLYEAWCQKGGIAVSMDTFYPVLQAAKKGLVQALVGQDFRRMGELTVARLAAEVRGEALSDQFIHTGLERIDASEVERWLTIKKPWVMK